MGCFRCPHTFEQVVHLYLNTHLLPALDSVFVLTVWTLQAHLRVLPKLLTVKHFSAWLFLSFSLSCCVFGCIIYVRMRPCVGEMQALLCSPLCSCYCCQCSCAVSGQSISISPSLSLSLSCIIYLFIYLFANWEVHSLNSFASYLILLTKFPQSISNSSGLALHLKYHVYLNC